MSIQLRIARLAGLFIGLILSQAANAVAGEIPHQTVDGAWPEPVTEAAGLRSVEELETFLDGVMADQLLSHEVVGAVISVVKDGELFFTKGYGWADREERIPMDGARHLVRPGSISKLFTWTAVMQLVEQGKVDLDADVNDYLKAFKVPDTLDKPITVRNLLTHTGGLEDGALGYLMEDSADGLEPLAQFIAKHIPARVREATTDFANDGGNASYSNWGTALAGVIIEDVSGQSFDDYIQKHIFDPLGMDRSTFAEPLPAELARDMANGYHRKDGLLTPRDFEFIHNFGPAGSLTSSAPDMARFMIAHLQLGQFGGQQILKPETARLMHSRQFSPTPYVNGSGLGFYETWINGRRLIAHGGDTNAFHSDLNLLMEEGVGLFVSYNSGAALPIRSRTTLLRAFMDHYYPARLPKVAPPENFSERAAQYAGQYRMTRHSYTKNEKVFSAFNSIKVAPSDRNTLIVVGGLHTTPAEYVEIAPHNFRRIDTDETMAFLPDASGEIQHVTLPLAFIAAYKLSLYETKEFHLALVGLALICGIGAIVGWLRHRREAEGQLARRLGALGGVLVLLTLGGLVMSLVVLLKDPIAGFPGFFTGVLVAIIVFALISLAVAGSAVLSWRNGSLVGWTRVRYSLIALSYLALLWSFHFWNLLGFKFG